jgi:PKD repeat protein
LWDSGAPRIVARPPFPPPLDAEIDGPVIWSEAHPSWGRAPLKVFFDVELLEAGTPEAWAWDFGDGSPIARHRAPEHVYRQPGVYEAHVWVRDTGGRIGLDSVKIRVE